MTNNIRHHSAYPDVNYPDSLDFLLRSVYDNATEVSADKARIRMQAESAIHKHNSTDAGPKKDSGPRQDVGPIKVAELARWRHENQWKCYTDSIHASQTNNGYSRQAAGGFFRWS